MLLLIPLVAGPRYFLAPGSTWWPGPRITGAVLVALLGLAAIFAVLGQAGDEAQAVPHALLVVLSVAAAAAGGGPLTEAIFGIVARRGAPAESRPGKKADASLLRGGMWIGLLERVAIASTLWAGWPEGLAWCSPSRALAGLPNSSSTQPQNSSF